MLLVKKLAGYMFLVRKNEKSRTKIVRDAVDDVMMFPIVDVTVDIEEGQEVKEIHDVIKDDDMYVVKKRRKLSKNALRKTMKVVEKTLKKEKVKKRTDSLEPSLNGDLAAILSQSLRNDESLLATTPLR
ncbi:hypothetical protein Tco_1190067, partial [Tanacetum coccineum]